MKAIIASLFCCFSVLADDGEIHVFSIVRTNSADIVYKDEFTRDGQTNLIRILRLTPEGQFKICCFYHAGQLVGNFIVHPAVQTNFSTEAGIYCMSLKYGPGGEILSSRIGDARGMLLDEFTFTNGTFSPVSGPLRLQVMKPRFIDEDKFIEESRAAEVGNAQFVDLTVEVEITQWPPGRAPTYTTAVHCVVGANSWEIDSELGARRSKSWYTGAKIVESIPGPRVMDSLDGNPSLPVRQSDRLTAPERIAWLAFCAGPCLKHKGHQLFPPGDLWKEMILAPSGFLERSAVFENGFGFPKSVDLHTTNGQPVLQFRVTATTNLLGQVFPLEFYLAQYRPAFVPEAHRFGTNGWELHITAKGKVSRVGVGTEPQVPPWIEAAARSW